MTNLIDQFFDKVEKSEPPLTRQDFETRQSELSDWYWVEESGIAMLEKTYTFKNFAKALQFANQVAELAERQNHHPRIVLEWGKVQVRWWTHVIRGVHKNDLYMAIKTDELAPY